MGLAMLISCAYPWGIASAVPLSLPQKLPHRHYVPQDVAQYLLFRHEDRFFTALRTAQRILIVQRNGWPENKEYQTGRV